MQLQFTTVYYRIFRRQYIKDLRTDSNKRLLISTVRPHGDANAQTIGHWIKSLLNKTDIDRNLFSSYSTRHAAASAVHQKSIDIDTIRRTASLPNRKPLRDFITSRYKYPKTLRTQ